MAVSNTQIQQLYVAYFARPADPVGLNFYATSAAAQTARGVSDAAILDSISSTFALSAEYTANFTGMSAAQTVNQVYQNLFSHSADLGGLLYWSGKLQDGSLTVSNLVRAISQSAVGANNVDGTAFSSKVAAAESFTASLTTAEQVLGYSGTSAGNLAKAFISSVNSAATLQTAIVPATLSATVGGVVTAGNFVAGQTFTLTTGADARTGGAGADSFDGSLGGTGGNLQTLGSTDILNGAGGTDTLTATLIGGTTTPTLSSVERLVINGTATATLDLINSTLYTDLSSEGTTGGALTFANINTLEARLSVNNSAQGAFFQHVASVVAGSADSEDLTLTNATGGTVTIAGIETLNVNSAGTTANNVTLTLANATRVNVTGSNNLTLAGVAVASTINGSAMTGALTTTLAVAGSLTGGSGNDSLTGSAGNDVLTGNAGNNTITAGAGIDTITATTGNDRIVFATAGNLTVADSVDAGAGTNTLSVTADDVHTNDALADTADLTALTRLTGIQAIEVTGVGAAAGSANINVARMAASVTTVNTVAVTGGTAAAFTFNTGASTMNVGTGATAAALGAGTTFAAAGTGTADSLTINRTSTAAENILNQALTVTGIETLNINTGAALNTIQGTGAIGWTPTTTNGAVTLNVSGLNQLTTGVITPVGTGLLTINGSGMTAQAAGTSTLITVAPVSAGGTVSIVGSSGQDVLIGDINDSNTIIGGDGVDTITGGSANDSLSGGNGNDSITSGAGVDNIDGGEGNDTIVVAAFLTTADTVAGGGGTADAMSVTSAMVATTLTYTNISGIEQVTVSDALVNNVVLSQVQAGINQVNLAAASNGNTITFDSGVAGTVSAAIDIGGAITVVSAGTGTADQITLANSSAATDVYVGRAITATGVETLVVNTTSTTAGTNKTAGVITITPTTLTAGERLTISGNGEFVATNVATTGTGLLTIDASGITDLTASSGVGNAFVFQIGAATLGTGGTESITGSAGNDSITTGNFASTVIGGAGSDSITGGSANDNLSSVSGENTIIGGGGRDTLTGGTGNDVITGNTGIDIITGNEGIDNITGGGGNDTISAGAGNDVISATVASADSVSISGDAGNDSLTLTGWNLVTAEDIIAGGADTDTLTVAVVNASAGAGSNVTGWETLVITTAGTAEQAMTTVLTTDTTINRIDFTGAANALQGVSSASANLATLRTVSNSDATGVGVAGGLYMTRTTNTTADALTFGAATDANMTLARLTVNGEETLTIGSGAMVAANARALVITELNDIQATTITISGSHASTAVTAVGASAAATGFGTTARAIAINGSAATGTVSFTGSTALATQPLTMTGSTTAANTLTGGLGADLINGGAAADSLTGGAGVDTINGLAGNDSLFGEAGNDQLTGGEGADIIRGGTGWDTITLTETTSAADRIDVTTNAAGTSEAFGNAVAGLSNDTGGDNVIGMAWGTDTVRITATNVTGTFVHGTNTAIGTEGDVNDGTAASFLANTGLVSFNNDVVYTGLGDVAITFTSPSATMTRALFEASLQYVLTGTGAAETITGGDLDDTISGGGGGDSLTGGAGADVINGASADTLTGGNGADNFNFAAATTSGTIVGGTGADVITFANGTNTVASISDVDGISINGGTGVDTLTFTAATIATTIVGGTGADVYNLGDFTNAISINDADSSITGGTGIDTITFVTTNTTNTTVVGGTGADVINLVGTGANAISINDATVSVTGGTGVDAITFITNAAAAVSIRGGTGADTIALATGTNVGVDISDTDGFTLSGGTINTVNFSSALAATTITGATGVDTYTFTGGVSNVATVIGGNGIDVINLGAAHTGGVRVDLGGILAVANRDNVTNFITTVDKIGINAANTSVATAVGVAPVVTADTTAAANGAGSYTMTGPTTANADVIRLTVAAASAGGTLSAGTSGTQLLVALSNNDTTYTDIVAVANTTGYLMATQTGVTYLYYFANDNNTALLAAEIFLVGVFNGVTVVAGDFGVLG